MNGQAKEKEKTKKIVENVMDAKRVNSEHALCSVVIDSSLNRLCRNTRCPDAEAAISLLAEQ